MGEILPLIRQYQSFYGVRSVSDSENRQFFLRFGEGSPFGCQFLYRIGSDVVGFATVYFSFASTVAARVAILNDLFTIPAHRGQGVGRALIAHCLRYAKANGAVRLQWQTAVDNEKAQVLYDSLGAKKSTWHIYMLKVGQG